MNPILTPGSTRGNNANGGVVRVLVMESDAELTGVQQAAVEQALQRHLQAYNLSLAGHLTDTVWLDDGSKVEFTSNSGQHDVKVWPGKPRPAPRFADLFFTVPGDGTGVAAWNPDYSGTWEFDGETQPPETLFSAREVGDQEGIGQHPGNLTWWNPDLTANDKPIIVSWIGRGTRYGRQDYYGHHLQFAAADFFEDLHSPADGGGTPSSHRTNWEDAFHPWVWIQGVRHEVYEVVDDEPVPVNVLSAGLQFDEDRQQHVLFVITHGDDGLAVYSGDVEPYGNDAAVEHVFDIPFKVDNTPFSSENQQWEALQQPLYFNQSCTHAAGIVIVKHGSTSNPTADSIDSGGTTPPANTYMAKLVQVDIEAESTTFTSAHASRVITVTHTGDAVHTREEVRISYGAVDWEGDDLRIAMCKYRNYWEITWSGTYVVGSLDLDTGVLTPDAMDGTATKTARTEISVFLQHDGTVLAYRDSGTILTGTITFDDFEAGGYTVGGVTGYGWVTGSGSFVESVTDPLHTGCAVAAGDLRHRFIVMAEFLETGTLDVNWPFDAQTESFIGANPVITSLSSDTRDRTSGSRYSAWREGNLIDTSGTTSVGYATPLQFHSQFAFGWGRSVMTLVIDVEDIHRNFFRPTNPQNPGDTFDYVPLGDLKLDELAVTNAVFGNPFVSNSNPYALGVAFTPDGEYGFFNIGPATDTFSVAHFLIGEDDFPITPADIVDMAHGALSSPVFLYQVPTEYPLQ